MKVIVGKLSGFCFGVNNAIKKTNELLEKQTITYCLGELVHNKGIIKDLKKKGLIIIENVNESPKNSQLIIRAHGVAPEIYQMARQNQNKVFDFTCPKVLEIHKNVEEKRKDHYIFIIGEKGHPESIGTKGFSGENSSLISTEEDIETAIIEFKKTNMKKIYVVAQTTIAVKKFDKFVEIILEKLKDFKIEINKSICESTEMRQKEVTEISKQVDYMIVIGGKKSSNTAKLYEIAIKNCPSIHIENKEELDLTQLKKYRKIGITAGASTPKSIINEVVELVEGIN